MNSKKTKELVVISGKGGTGKTSVTAALASFFPHKVLVDGDVDAADLHLLLKINSTKGIIRCDRAGFWFKLLDNTVV